MPAARQVTARGLREMGHGVILFKPRVAGIRFASALGETALRRDLT
jgi:hypothetical protein